MLKRFEYWCRWCDVTEVKLFKVSLSITEWVMVLAMILVFALIMLLPYIRK